MECVRCRKEYEKSELEPESAPAKENSSAKKYSKTRRRALKTSSHCLIASTHVIMGGDAPGLSSGQRRQGKQGMVEEARAARDAPFRTRRREDG